ncbi:hypothetical protein EXN66_Car010178 [Channa argus]|uniref:Uncharacterized protein n=1 Tax=Channa argus TaxID=215402 RepID=A0A6G1PW69_CHAAH|nr:hypothetical protein EXN66_Car010178 [Channa argus]
MLKVTVAKREDNMKLANITARFTHRSSMAPFVGRHNRVRCFCDENTLLKKSESN